MPPSPGPIAPGSGGGAWRCVGCGAMRRPRPRPEEMRVMSVAGASRSARHDRPLFGWRRKPGRLVLAVFRLPLTAYRHNAGPAVGHTFVAFTHTGRKTGRPHDTVAMVL